LGPPAIDRGDGTRLFIGARNAQGIPVDNDCELI
jgi:hypothetical protein